MILYSLKEVVTALWSCSSLIEVYMIQRALLFNASYYSQNMLDEFQKYCDKRIQMINKQIGK